LWVPREQLSCCLGKAASRHLLCSLHSCVAPSSILLTAPGAHDGMWMGSWLGELQTEKGLGLGSSVANFRGHFLPLAPRGSAWLGRRVIVFISKKDLQVGVREAGSVLRRSLTQMPELCNSVGMEQGPPSLWVSKLKEGILHPLYYMDEGFAFVWALSLFSWIPGLHLSCGSLDLGTMAARSAVFVRATDSLGCVTQGQPGVRLRAPSPGSLPVLICPLWPVGLCWSRLDRIHSVSSLIELMF
jgi:hypothetical protein